MTRYHPALVALHWVMAIMILMGLFFGKFVLTAMDNADPEKVQGLGGHMTIGLLVGVLLVARLIVRFASEKPPHAETGHAVLDRLGAATHWVLYSLVALMVLSGLGTALGGGLFPIVFGGSGDPIPADLNDLAPRMAHGLVSNLLILLLLLHVAAALYHQFFLRDGLFGRMWFGKRKLSEADQ
ncbi:cytochrome b [Oricola sp.]|uniref:cytochrome b n=1 Tax=Oricola sp. TaxID=1979950 RepID=UPI003BAB3068